MGIGSSVSKLRGRHLFQFLRGDRGGERRGAVSRALADEISCDRCPTTHKIGRLFAFHVRTPLCTIFIHRLRDPAPGIHPTLDKNCQMLCTLPSSLSKSRVEPVSSFPPFIFAQIHHCICKKVGKFRMELPP